MVEISGATHYVVGDALKFVGSTLEVETLIFAAGAAYGNVTFSVTSEGRLVITTDIIGSIPVYVLGKWMVTTDHSTAAKFGKPEVVRNAIIHDVENEIGFRYYTLRIASVHFTESDKI